MTPDERLLSERMRMRTMERKDFVYFSYGRVGREKVEVHEKLGHSFWPTVFFSDRVPTTLGDGGGKLSGENSAGRRDAGARGAGERRDTAYGPYADILALLLY